MTPYTLDAYRSILRTAIAAGYAFAPFTVQPETPAKRIHLRHDVDYSIEIAVEMAEVNASLGVRATFFVLIRSQIYNLLSGRSLAAARRILELGQWIGLHVPTSPDALANDAGLSAYIRRDWTFLQGELTALSRVFAWHNPTDDVLERFAATLEVAGLVNAYSTPFFKATPYYSDTNMRHTVEAFASFVGPDGPQVFQLAFHPLNWVVGGTDMREIFAATWARVIREREHDFATNHVYSGIFPEGMPLELLGGFSERWLTVSHER